MIEFHKLRREDNTIDLVKLYREIYGRVPSMWTIAYLQDIEKIQWITSRQVAAHAVITAHHVTTKDYKDVGTEFDGH